MRLVTMALLLVAFILGLAGCRSYLNPRSPYFPPERAVDRTSHYTLGIVELDDQGWFKSREQAQRVFDEISQTAGKERAIIVVFIHGWHHDARPDDENLGCLRATLKRLDEEVNDKYFTAIRESLGEARPLRVLGLYVGWRGRSLPGFLDYSTFWDRKAAGHRAGGSDLREFLQQLGTLQKNLNAAGHFTGLVTIGHSFGGAVVENSLLQPLSRDLVEAVPINGSVDLQSQEKVLGGFGDLVVLINPAFEASLYNNIMELSRRAVYSSEQTPILMTLSAKNDGPRRTLFPLGRFISTLRQGTVNREQRRAIQTALGVYAPQITHDLRFEAQVPKEKARTPKENCGVDLGLRPEDRVEFRTSDLSEARNGKASELKTLLMQLPLAAKRSIYGSVLEPRGKIDPNLPFLVVEASKDVINGHNGFFNRRLINFLVGYIGRAEAKTLLVKRHQLAKARQPVPPQ